MLRIMMVFVVLSGACATALEQPRYDIVKKYKGFELRRYAPYLAAETEVTAEFDRAGNQAFRILFRYISGDNRGKEKIAMTAPVNQAPKNPAGEKISMTAPVIQQPAEPGKNTYLISFVMPSKYTLDSLPEPLDPRVRFRRVNARLMAALTYSGTWSMERYRRKEAELVKTVTEAGLSIIGEPVFARYDPPFMPWFLKRNEVLVEVKAP